jgi:hypothetical protein
MLQALGGSARECRSDGVAVLALEVGKESSYVALQGLAALGATKQRGERLEEGRELRQGVARSFGHGLGYIGSLVHAYQHTAILTK